MWLYFQLSCKNLFIWSGHHLLKHLSSSAKFSNETKKLTQASRERLKLVQLWGLTSFQVEKISNCKSQPCMRTALKSELSSHYYLQLAGRHQFDQFLSDDWDQTSKALKLKWPSFFFLHFSVRNWPFQAFKRSIKWQFAFDLRYKGSEGNKKSKTLELNGSCHLALSESHKVFLTKQLKFIRLDYTWCNEADVSKSNRYQVAYLAFWSRWLLFTFFQWSLWGETCAPREAEKLQMILR